MLAVVPCPQKAKESLSFRRLPNLPKLTFPVDRSSKLMNHPSSTSTLDSTLCHRSNHRSLLLSPCLAQLKRQSLSDFSCCFLLIKFQTPNKAYSLAGAVPVIRPYPSSASQTLSTTTTVPCRGFSCSTVPLLPLADPKGLTRHYSPRPFNFPTGAQDLSCRNPTIPVTTSPAGTFPVRSFETHISSLRRLDDLLLATRACKATVVVREVP